MPGDIVDDRLIGALHVRALRRRGLAHDPVVEHEAVQAGTIEALLAGKYEGDATLAEILEHGDLGIGTIQQLDGELVVLDGVPWVTSAEGVVRRVPESTRTPFAVVCAFVPEVERDVTGPLDWHALTTLIDDVSPPDSPVVAVRLEGVFTALELRSVHRQVPPYPPLTEVAAHQTRWEAHDVRGTLLGFRFPDATAGVEVPGYHLHFLAADKATGGHVLSLQLAHGHLAIASCDELHVELPAGVELGSPGAVNRDSITRAEGQH